MFSPEAYALAEGLVSRAYINQGSQATARRSKLVTSLLSERRLPKDGWDDHSIEAFLSEAAMMDSNNFLDNVGVGEREARMGRTGPGARRDGRGGGGRGHGGGDRALRRKG